jgi:CRP/FNR family transcriptional regulator, cyclic AMP receptor protein
MSAWLCIRPVRSISAQLGLITPIQAPDGEVGRPAVVRGVAPFTGMERLEPTARQAILDICDVRSYPRGTQVMRQDAESDELHLLDRGHVAIRRSAGGVSFLIAVIGPGGAYGESALAGRRTRLASAHALDDIDVRVIPREGFEDLRERVPAVERFLVELMDWELGLLMTRLAEASSVPADRRVLRRVVELAGAFEDPGRPMVVVPLAQEDVASLASVTRPTANRVLQAAAQRGLLQLGWRRIMIPDVRALEAAAYATEVAS